MQEFKDIFYKRVIIPLQRHKVVYGVARFFYRVFYQNTPLNKEHRIKKWVQRNVRFMEKNRLNPMEINGNEVLFVNEGIKYVYNTKVYGGGSPKFKDKDSDKALMDYVIKKLPKKPTVLDIGANIGMYSLTIAQAFPEANIHAFEPVDPAYSMLAKNVEVNVKTNISCHKLAVSDDVGEMVMSTNQFLGNHIVTKKTNNTTTIKTTTVDAFVEKNNIKNVDFIKCDIEGAELLMLKGATETLKKQKPLIVLEIIEPWTRRYNYKPQDIVSFLQERGYSYKIVGRTIREGKSEQLDEELKESMNFIFEA